MSTARVCLRLAALVAWTGALAAALAIARTLAAIAVRRSTPADRAFRLWARGACRIVGMRVEATGSPPRDAFFLVANHLSYLDVIALGSLVDATFVAKAEVAAWPIVGALCRAVGTIFVDRRCKRDLLRVVPLVERRLRAGASVVVFPEGTTSDGSSVLPFKSSLFEAAVRAGRPAHVATVTYATAAGAPHPARAVCWWGDMEFGRHFVELLSLPGVRARIEFVPAPLFASDRKRLCRSSLREVRGRFLPVTRGDAPWQPVAA